MEATSCLRLELRNIETCCRCSGSIKGASAGGEAVLCTRDRTYALKHVQTTNTVLLMPSDAEARSRASLSLRSYCSHRYRMYQPPVAGGAH